MGGGARRVAFLGLDGLSPYNYAEIRRRGLLSSLKELESRAVRGSARMVHPLTPPMWTSMTTGVNPGKHGIYFFILTDRLGNKVRLHHAGDVGFPRVHHAASYMGLRSLVANLPLSTWPYIPFRGALLPDWVAARHVGHPASVAESFKRSYKTVAEEYAVEKDYYCKLIHHDLALARSLLELTRDPGWLSGFNYVFIMFSFTDTLMHKNPSEVFKPERRCVTDLYGMVSEVFERVLENVLDEGLVILAGDHGIDPAEYRVTVSRMLYEAGLVKATYAELAESIPVNRAEGGGAGRSAAARLASALASLLLSNPITGRAATRLGRWLLRGRPWLARYFGGARRPVPDPESSIVIVPKVWHYGLFVNEGLVDNVDAVVERVKEILRDFEEVLGHRFLYAVEKGRGGIFRGPYQSRAPHIVVAPRRGYSMASMNLYAPLIERDARRLGDHHPENLHLIAAPRGDAVLEEAARLVRDPWDYAILAYLALGIPLPRGHDSRIPRLLGVKAEEANYLARYEASRRLALRLSRGG